MTKSKTPAVAAAASVSITRNSGADPAPLVATLLAGQAFPFQVTVKHNNIRPLVVPSTGLVGDASVLTPGVETLVKVKSEHQAWLLVTDLAEFAHMANNDAEDFAQIVAPAVAAPAEEAAQ